MASLFGIETTADIPFKLQPLMAAMDMTKPAIERKAEAFNLHPDLITFILITVPHVEGLPLGVETTNYVPSSFYPLVMTSMDLTELDIEASLRELKLRFVFFDLTCWLLALTHRLGIKSVLYARKILEKGLIGPTLLEPPEGFPSSNTKLRAHEARGLASVTTMEYGSGISFVERHLRSASDCDAICFRTCREIEGPYCEHIGNQFKKPVIFVAPVVPKWR
ncbi:hypothetical protein DITRI_Ditri19aG0043200 [Diplodiscus trichospermus]